jgi:hypothetical protein
VRNGSPPRPRRLEHSRRRCLLFGSLLPIGWILQLLGSAFPDVTETWFSRGVGPWVQSLIGIPVRILPFSLAELLLIGLGTYVSLALGRGLLAWRKHTLGLGAMLERGGLRLLAAGGLIYFFFVIAWGMNYARPTFADNAGWELGTGKTGDLERLAERLARRAGELRVDLEEDEQGIFRLRGGKQGVLEDLSGLFEGLAGAYPFLEGPAPISRRPWISPLLTVLGISGIFSPFTGESLVNGTLLDLPFAFAACHEAAHGKGVAREDEANFVAYKACMFSDRTDLQYAGTVVALNYSLNDLFRNDADRARELLGSLSPAVTRDRQAMAEFWRPKTRTLRLLRLVGEEANDTYLKSQRQSAGTASYGHVVRLLIADEQVRTSGAER